MTTHAPLTKVLLVGDVRGASQRPPTPVVRRFRLALRVLQGTSERQRQPTVVIRKPR
jgi:hypothetical protein